MDTALKPPQTKAFLGYLHSFRGFAIANIAAVHSFVAPIVGAGNGNYDISNPAAILNEVLFHDSTIYFAIISGLLFTAVLRGKGYKRFFTSKLKYVLLPYSIFTLLFSLLGIGFLEGGPSFLGFFKMLGFNLITGKAMVPYWYIPVLFWLYAITPLLDGLLKQGKWGMGVLILLALIPLVVSRIGVFSIEFIRFENMIYFTGGYVVGMLMGVNMENTLAWIQKNIILLVIIAAISTGALTWFYIAGIEYVGPVSVLESVFYLQKLALSAIFILVFYRMGEQQPKWLGIWATNAFGIYFIHMIIAMLPMGFMMTIFASPVLAPLSTILWGILFTFVTLVVSSLIITGLRKLLGRYSRMIVGS